MTIICAAGNGYTAICSVIILHSEDTAGKNTGADCGDVTVVDAVCDNQVAIVVSIIFIYKNFLVISYY